MRTAKPNGSLVRDVSAYVGTVLALGGIGLLPIQYLVWLKTGVWAAMEIGTVFDLMGVATPQGLDAVLKLPLSGAMFMVGLVFIWIAAEIYERHAGHLRIRSETARSRRYYRPNRDAGL